MTENVETPVRTYRFNRYVYGVQRAEGACVEARSEAEALEKAKRLFWPLDSGETFSLRYEPEGKA